jgi:hypothetical protein
MFFNVILSPSQLLLDGRHTEIVDDKQAITGAFRPPSLLKSTAYCPPFPGYSVGIINELPRVSFQNGRFRQRLTVFFILPGQQTNGRLYLLIFDKTHG